MSIIGFDDWTREHFRKWLERSVHASERWATARRILRVLKNDPELLESFSWPELERTSR